MTGAERIIRRSISFRLKTDAGSVLNKCRTVIRVNRMERYLALPGLVMLILAVCEMAREPFFYFRV